MLTPQNDIRLIDFNIALALGEEGAVAVGRSFGYASPEHYGSDVLLGGQTASLWGSLRNDADKTELMKPEEYPCGEENGKVDRTANRSGNACCCRYTGEYRKIGGFRWKKGQAVGCAFGYL